MAGRRHRWLLALSILLWALGGCTVFGGASGTEADDPDRTEQSTTDPPAEEQSATDDGSAAADVEGEGAEPTPSTLPTPSIIPQNGELFELLEPDERIVVQTADNNLRILTFAGEVDGPTNRDATQPVFSPDGSRLAWTAVNPSRNGGVIVFGDVGADGTVIDPVAFPTPFLSFYSVWAPGDSDRLAILGNSGGGVGVAVVDRADGSTDVLDRGAPYYFGWNTRSDGLVGHVDTALRTFDLDTLVGTSTTEVLPSFRAPAQMRDGSAVYIAVENRAGSAGQSAVVRLPSDPSGQSEFTEAEAETVARFDGLGALSMSPDSTKLAIAVDGALTNAQIFNSSSHAAGFQSNEALDRGLHVLDTATDEIVTVTAGPTIAAFWSPDSTMLATLRFDSIGDGQPWARWTIFSADGTELSRSHRFIVSRQFAGGYLPFWDQYAEAVRLWSPDSTRLVFPGESMAGEEGIWMHRIPVGVDDAATYLIAEGAVALWSP